MLNLSDILSMGWIRLNKLVCLLY